MSVGLIVTVSVYSDYRREFFSGTANNGWRAYWALQKKIFTDLRLIYNRVLNSEIIKKYTYFYNT